MKTTFIAKVVLLYLLAIVSIVCILSEPVEENWLTLFFVSRSIGFATAYLLYKLWKRWEKDFYFRKFIQWLDKDVEQ